MRELVKWVALLFIAVVALSPIFEVFDKTDGWPQDTSDLARYVICLFCFFVFSLYAREVLFGGWIFDSSFSLVDYIISIKLQECFPVRVGIITEGFID